jgi:hypothetical protein
MLPIPAAGIMPQSVPMAADDSVIDGDGEAAWWEAAGAAGAAAGAELPQAAAVIATTPATAPAARRPAGLAVFPCLGRMDSPVPELIMWSWLRDRPLRGWSR